MKYIFFGQIITHIRLLHWNPRCEIKFHKVSIMCHCAGLLHRYKDSQINIKNGEHYVIHENGTLEIHVAQPLNSGKYTCIATNNLGVRENHVFLEVKGQADFGGCMSHAIVQDIHSLTRSCSLIPTRTHPYPQTA